MNSAQWVRKTVVVTLFAVAACVGQSSAYDLKKMIADHERPCLYAIQRGAAGSEDSLLFIDVASEAVVNTIPIGFNVTDMAVHYGESRLYVTNWGYSTTRVVDLVSQTELPSLNLGTDVYRINAGRPGRVYFEGEDQWVQFRVVDTGTGAVVGSAPFSVREGDGEIGPTGAYYYHCDNNSSDARIHKYDIQTDTPVEVALGSRHPFGSRRVVMSADGTRLFWQGYVCDENLNDLGAVGTEIYETTSHGEFAFGSSRVYNSVNGAAIYTLPFATTVMAVTGDDEKLFLYSPATGGLTTIPISEIGVVLDPASNPVPGDGATVWLPLAMLEWDDNPGAFSYHVYLGTDSAGVDGAGTSSPEYRGEVSTSEIDLGPNLELGETYYWRVDAVGHWGMTKGAVWSFGVAPVVVSPMALEKMMITVGLVAEERLVITADGGAETWSMSEGIPWLSLDKTGGTTPDSVVVTFDVMGLTPGTYTGSLHFVSGESDLEIPVTLEVFRTALSKMAADLTRPYVYALHPGSGAIGDAFLLFLNTESEQIERVIPIGTSPTDMAIHYGEDRLYVTNWGYPTTRVVDLETQTELPPLALGTDVYRINAGRPGRIYTEGEDQWVDAKIVDTMTGSVVGSLPGLYEGDAEISPTGSYYYHCDSGISDARIHKYDIRTDSPVLVAESNLHPYGSLRTLVLSADGTRLFWRGYVYDANLDEFGSLWAEIYETTLHGELAFGSSKVYDAANGSPVCALPFSTKVMAVSGDQEKLFLFNPVTGAIVRIRMDKIRDVAGPELHPDPVNGAMVVPPLAGLEWDDCPGALSYLVYIGTDSAGVDGAGPGSPEHIGEVTESGIALSVELALGQAYYWRVDVVGFSATTKGMVWSFDVAPLSVSPNRVAGLMVTTGGASVREKLLVTAGGAIEGWTVNESEPWVSVDKTAGATPDTIVVTMDPTGLPVGTHAGALHFAAGGTEFDVPVELELFTMTLSKMATDLTRPYIYALHPGDGNFGAAYLLFINTGTEKVERVIPIGMDPTDMAIHGAEGRLYVTNWMHPATRVVDLVTQKEIASLSLGTDVYRINAGRSGRIYFEGEDQFVQGKIVNTGTGLVVGSLPSPLREGDGEIGPAGSFYYHCDNNISNAAIHKFDIRTDRPTEMAVSIQHPSGSRNLVLSGDGKRLFWRGYMYDQYLNEMRTLGEEIYATNRTGGLAFGSDHVFDTLRSVPICTFQFSTTVMAVSGDQEKLFMYKPFAHRIVVLTLDELLAVPVFVTRFEAVSSEAGVALSWETISDESVKGFNIYRDDGSGDAPVRVNAGGLVPPGEERYVDRDVRGGHDYEYTLGVVLEDGTETMSHAVSVTTIAFRLALLQNHPNPFNPTTTIPFTLPQRTRVTLAIYDVAGRLVRTLADEVIDEGRHEPVWDGKDSKGATVSSGVYFYRLTAGNKTLVKKMVVLR